MAQSFEVFHGLAEPMLDIPAGSVVNHIIFANDQVQVAMFGFAPGQELVGSFPAHPAIFEIWRGEGVMILDEEAYEIGPGSWVYVDGMTPHTLQARSEMVALVTLLNE